MTVTASMVRELRESTGAAMMDCKKALEATGGDMQAAVDHLRKAGMKSAAKKADRETAEGRVFDALNDDRTRGHMLAVACETDFLSKGDGFVGFVKEFQEHVAKEDPTGLEGGERPLFVQNWQGSGATVRERIQEAIGSLKENIQVTSLVRFENPAGRVGTYIHHDYKKGAIVSVTTEADPAKADEVLKSLCQHVVVFQPGALRREDVAPEDVEREKAVIRESDEVKKKPEEFRDKIVEGKLGKFFAGTCLEEQPWIHDDKSSVAKAIEKELGKGSRIEAFQLVHIG